MKTGSYRLLGSTAIIMFAGGCASTPVLHPPEADLRASLGRVAVVTLTDSPRIRFQVPDSKADVAAEPSFLAGAAEWMSARQERVRKAARNAPDAAPAWTADARRDPATEIGPYVPVDAVFIAAAYVWSDPTLVVSPIAPEIRRAYGLVVADTARAVAAARTALDAAAANTSFSELLRERLLAGLGRAAPNFAAASPRNADTILELFVYEPNVSSASGEGINPGLGLSLGLRVRLLNARTGAELYYDYLDYRGPRHTFVNWAADDARIFRNELDRCVARLSAEVVAQLFTRPSTETADRSTLAALGLERRPPSPVLPNGGTLWSPTYRPAVYARN